MILHLYLIISILVQLQQPIKSKNLSQSTSLFDRCVRIYAFISKKKEKAKINR